MINVLHTVPKSQGLCLIDKQSFSYFQSSWERLTHAHAETCVTSSMCKLVVLLQIDERSFAAKVNK